MGLDLWPGALAFLGAQEFMHKCPDSFIIKNGMKSQIMEFFQNGSLLKNNVYGHDSFHSTLYPHSTL